MNELKPCPFCGRIPTVDDCGDNRFFVRCKCGIVQDKLYGQRCDAVRRWNTRRKQPDDPDANVGDMISRQAAIDTLHMDTSIIPYKKAREYADATILEIRNRLEKLPSAQPEIIRCKDCEHWDTTWQNDFAPNYHYCPLIDGTRRDDFYCADAEMRGEQDE